MLKTLQQSLSRRERQIMDLLYLKGRATAGEVMAALPGAPSDSTVRTQLRVLEGKGHVKHEHEGHRFVYMPVVSRRAVRKSALRHLVDTFFDGSAERVVEALLGGSTARISRRNSIGCRAHRAGPSGRHQMTLALALLKLSALAITPQSRPGSALFSGMAPPDPRVGHWLRPVAAGAHPRGPSAAGDRLGGIGPSGVQTTATIVGVTPDRSEGTSSRPSSPVSRALERSPARGPRGSRRRCSLIAGVGG
jgi:predicted transcriptional regulator